MGLLAIIGTAGVCLPALLRRALSDVTTFHVGLIVWMILAVVVGCVLFAIGDRVPTVLCYVLPALAVPIWTAGAAVTTPGTTSKIYLCWAVLYAAFFYRPVGAWTMTGYCVIACGVLSFTAYPTTIALANLGAVGAGLCGITAVVASLRSRELRMIERLRTEAHVDSLTGLTTRRVLETAFAGHASGHPATPISLVLADVDGLKAINDAYGHPVGDRVLIELATTAMMAARSDDVVTRLGGDETAVLMPGRTYTQAVSYASKLERALALVDVAPGSRWRMSISVGVATAPNDGVDLDALYATADRRLYRAKRSRMASNAATATQDTHDDERNHRNRDDGDHDVLEGSGVLLDLVPALAETITGDDEDGVPDQTAGQGEDQEGQQAHPLEPGGNRDQAAEDRDHPAEEHRLAAMPLEPRLGAVDIVELDEGHLVDDGPQPVATEQNAYVIEHDRTDDRTDRGRDDDGYQVELPAAGGEAGERKDDLAR